MDRTILILQLGIPITLLLLGLVMGKLAERRHYADIYQREDALVGTPSVTMKTLSDPRPVKESRLAIGSVVVSVDHYKRFLMAFRRLFGGEILSYASLIDRGRREAVLRMKESCREADLFINCRIETSTISSGAGRATGTVEVLAYGTAVVFEG